MQPISTVAANGLSVHVLGDLVSIPFGIRALKTTTHVDRVINLSKLSDGVTLQIPGTVALHLGIEDNAGELDADIKVSVLSMEIFDKKIPLVAHLAAGTVPIHVGGGQETFTGSVTISAGVAA